jgi:hypothetical protein
MERNTEENEFLRETEDYSGFDRNHKENSRIYLLWFHLFWFLLGVSSVLFLFSKFVWS